MNDYWNDPPDEPEAPQCPNLVPLRFRDPTTDGRCQGNGKCDKDFMGRDIYKCDECGCEWPIPDPPTDDPNLEAREDKELRERLEERKP